MSRSYAATFFCAAALSGLGLAQNTGPKCDDPAPTKAGAPKHLDCPPAPSVPKNVDAGAKAALACEWIEPAAVGRVLEALRYYTIPVDAGVLLDPTTAKTNALRDLIQGDPTFTGLYTAALGDPDTNGRPQAQGLPDFLDDISEANTLNEKKPDNEDLLLEDAGQRIDEIFATPTGMQDLMKVNDSFSHDKHVALYQLLKAYPGYNGDPSAPATQDYACRLEVLRAAYQMSSDRLAKLVADKISPAKK